MKILIIARGCPNNFDSVYGNFEYEQAVALQKMGVDIIFSFIDRRSRTTYKRTKGLKKWEGFPFPVYGGYTWPVIPFKYFPRLSTWLYSKRFFKLFKMILEKEGVPDIIHCHYLFNIPLAALVAKKYGIPVVETEHWSDIKKQKLPNYVFFLSRYYDSVHSVVTVSEALKKTLEQKFNVNSERIYNMVANDYFENIPPRKKSNNTVQLITIGSLIHRKGFDILIEALSGLEPSDWELTIIGEGPLHEDIQKQINGKALGNRIILLGKQDKKSIKDLMNKSDVFVLASRSETFGVVYIEAMACGIPVIATRCGGPEEFVTSEIGKLVEVEDVEGLRSELKWMINNYLMFDRELIQMRCYEQFSSDKIASEYINVYRRILDSSKIDYEA